MRKFILPFIFLVLSFFTTTTFAQQSIIGGNTIPIEDAPYQVSLVDWSPIPNYTGGPTFICGGWLISDEWILTAA